MLEGDNVAIIPGSRVPFMVRKTHAAPESVVEINQMMILRSQLHTKCPITFSSEIATSTGP